MSLPRHGPKLLPTKLKDDDQDFYHPPYMVAVYPTDSCLDMSIADAQSLSAAHVILLATELCSTADFESLQALQHHRSDILKAELCCRILLTFVSGNEDPNEYVPLLKQLRGVAIQYALEERIDIAAVKALSQEDARKRIRKMHLRRLEPLDFDQSSSDDVVVRFVIQQACRLDAETGDLPAILQLVEPFINDTELLRRWLISNLLPLLRLDYEYYSDGGPGLSLEAFRRFEGSAGLHILLQRAKTAEGKTYIGRDLRGIVGPWMYGAPPSKWRKPSHSFRGASTNVQKSSSARQEPKWQDVNEWILRTSLDDFYLAAEAICSWSGPGDVDLGGYEGPAEPITEELTTLSMKYGQAALATVYAMNLTSPEATQKSWCILERLGDIAKVEQPRNIDAKSILPDRSVPLERIIAMPRGALSYDTLLEHDNALTWPSSESLNFLEAILISLRFLGDDLHCQQQLSCRSATNLCLFATMQIQQQEMHKILQNFARVASLDTDWHSFREKILWLSRWSTKGSLGENDKEDRRALFWRVSNEDVETEIFKAMLTAKEYKTSIAVYLADTTSSPLPFALVEKLVEDEILNAYDNASNGNRTRGGMMRASEMLKAFGPYFSPSSPVNKIEHLLVATHSLSFYQLTLQHGVPFQPVSIRAHNDPISLISKVLEQNPKAYTKLDDLLSIGRGLVAAGLPASSTEEKDLPSTSTLEDTAEGKMIESDHRISYDAIVSALSSNDFDTAYSYILTRLSPQSQPTETSSPLDDTSWRAAYAAGRHRPPSSTFASPSAQIAFLSKRMELLSLALTLVPDPSSLESMLATWQSCEEELNTLRAREAAEEKAWDDRGDNISSLPGGFGMEDRDKDIAETRREREKRRAAQSKAKVGSGRYGEDEAPMGLFDVARGAARAIGKSAFPLRGATGAPASLSVGDKGARNAASRSSDYSLRSANSGEIGDEGRVRKRDMVSNMVTGGLVSGLGWVLGAQPVKDSEGRTGQQGED